MVLVGTGAGSGPTAILGAPLREGTKEFQLPLEKGGERFLNLLQQRSCRP